MYKITVPVAVWQWDINDTIAVEGIEDISKWQVHFASTGDSNALVLEINPDMTCYIPNQLVELGQAIYAYLYNVDEQRAYTETAVLISVKARPRPLDYISTPTEVLTWGELRADIGALADLMTDSKSSLVVAVNELHSDIETAKTEQNEDIAAIKSDIDDIKQDITDIKDTDAAQSRQIAQNQQDIDELAQSDTQLAKSVSSLAQTVDKGFKQVQTELDKKQPKGDYITNAVDNLVNYYLKSETYTQSEVKDLIGSLTHINIEAVSSIDDVTEPNVIYLVPASSGESDDYYNEYILVNGSPELIGNTRVDLSDYYTREQTNDLLNDKQPIGNYATSVNGTTPDKNGNINIDVQTYTAGDGISINEGAISVKNPMDDAQVSAGTTWSSAKIISSVSQSFSQSGSIITCQPVEGSELHVVSEITAVQEGEGDPSPDNVRPISGWDSASLTRCGKNLLPQTYKTVSSNGVTYTVRDDKSIVISGMATGYSNIQELLPKRLYIKDFYYYIKSENANNIAVQSYANNDPTLLNLDTFIKYTGSTNFSSVIFTIKRNKNNRATSGTFYPMIVCSNTDTSYEPYRGQTYTADFPETVYGGALDWATGVLTKTHEYIASYQGESVGDEWISSTGLLSTGAEVLYRLDEPEVIQLSPHQILAITGTNTVYCDTGNVTVTGYEDPRHTVARLTSRIAAIESAAAGI